MPRYVDADKLMAALWNGVVTGSIYGPEDIDALIKDFPAADVEPVRHGRNVTAMNPVDEFVCSECGFIMQDFCRYDPNDERYSEFVPKFCPSCGAKMDEGGG